MSKPLAQPDAPNEGRKFALLIGINQYEHGIPRLLNAVPDVRLIAQVLKDKHGYELELLLDKQATLSGLRARLGKLPGELSANDRLILYFAGHGIAEEVPDGVDGPEGFFLPQDASRNDHQTFLPMREVQKQLDGLRCRHMLLLLDCCFAGAFRWAQSRSVLGRPVKMYRERYDRYLRDEAWQVITSAAHDETALDAVAGGKLGKRSADRRLTGNSPFAAALSEALHGAADLPLGGQPPDGVMAASEIYLYLEDHFNRLETDGSRQPLHRTMQKPLLWSFGGRHKGQFIFLTPGRTLCLPSALEVSEKNNPYRGLEPYEKDDGGLFFGRDEVVEQLCRQVLAQPLTVVSGVSGSGKSSLVRAGLVYRLSNPTETDPDRSPGTYPDTYSAWSILPPVRPGNRPLAALAFLNGKLDAPEKLDLASAVQDWRKRNASTRLLLIIDQLEELVTMGAPPAEQQQFLEKIDQARVSGGDQLHVVMTLRSDFEPHFLELLTPKPGMQVRFLARPLNRQELRQVIEGPASERVLYFEPASLVEQLIDEVAEMPGALPLLSFTMRELYRSYVRSGRSGRYLAAEDYQKLNGVTGALSQRADEIFQNLDPAHQGTLRRVMLRMVALEAGEVARRRVPRHELSYGPDHPEESRVTTVLQRLLDARLVVSGNDSESVPYVEPAHDKLVLGWPKLWSFIKQEQESIPLHRLLTQEAVAWDKKSRDKDHLWSANPRLPLLVDLRQKMPERFNTLEDEFIRSSQAAQQRLIERERRRQQELEESLEQAREQKRLAEDALARAEQAREQAEQRELDMVVEQGRQLLVEKDKPLEAVLWLHWAYERGSTSAVLPYLLADAMRPLDATRLVLQGHTDTVAGVSFSPDGRRIVTASYDRTARLWDAQTGQPLLILHGHMGLVTDASLSPDGRCIVTASSDHTARLWDAQTGQPLLTIEGHTQVVNSARFSPDGRRIVTASSDHTARLWDAQTGQPVLTLQGHPHYVTRALFSPDGRCIVTASSDHTARLWDAQTGQPLLILQGHTEYVVGVSFSPDGRRIVTASHDKTVRLWDAQTGQPLLSLQGHTEVVNGASFSPDGRRIVTASDDKTVRLWDVQTGQPMLSLQGHTEYVRGASFSPDGHHIVTASGDKTARLWDAQTGQPLLSLQGHRTALAGASFSPDGRRIVTASYDKTARLWDAWTGQPLLTLQGHTKSVNSARFSPDGRRIVTASSDHTARLWDVQTGQPLLTLQGHTSDVHDASFSPDGRRIVTVSDDATARFWDEQTGHPVFTLQGHTEYVRGVSFSPDGCRIVTASCDKTARLWDANTGEPLLTLQGHTEVVNGVSFSADGSRIITASKDKTARLWDALTGQPLLTLQGHISAVHGAHFSPDGHRIVTASEDNTTRLWNAQNGQPLLTLQGHMYGVFGARFSPDSARIVTAGYDNTAQIWSVGAEVRASAQLARILRCRLALRLEGAVVVDTAIDTTACENVAEAQPPLPRWAQRDSSLLAGVYALQVGQTDMARKTFQQARESLSYFQDGLGLAKLDLAETALDAEREGAAPAALAKRIGTAPPDEQANWWQELASFAQNELYRPQWSLWAIEQALNLGPRDEDDDKVATLLVSRLDALLAANQAAAVLQRGPDAWDAQRGGSEIKVVVAATIWLAASQQKNSKERRTWARRLLAHYVEIATTASLGWNFSGSRRAFLNQPDSAVRTQTIELFTLLEHKKSAETVETLAKLLELPIPKPAPAMKNPDGQDEPGSRSNWTARLRKFLLRPEGR